MLVALHLSEKSKAVLSTFLQNIFALLIEEVIFVFLLLFLVVNLYFVNVLRQREDRLRQHSGRDELWLISTPALVTEYHILSPKLHCGPLNAVRDLKVSLRFNLLLWFLICLLSQR